MRVTRLAVTSITVTGVATPSAEYRRVMPIFLPTSPSAMIVVSVQLDFHVHTGGEVELHQRIHGLVRGLDNVHDPLVRADLELVARLLVRMRRAIERVALDLGRQRNRPAHERARALGGVDNLLRRAVDQTMIERL